MGKAAKFLLLLSGRLVPLLDKYSGAAAAYSLRSLTSSSTTNVVKVRRSGDDAELDFTADKVSDGTLAAWVVAGGGTEDGFVTTWYDQSGNTNNATQATAASQPKIVISGTLVTENGKAAVDFDGTDDYLSDNFTIAISNGFTIVSVVKENTTATFNNGVYSIGSDATYGITKFYNGDPNYTPFTIAIQSSADKFRPTGSISRNTNQNLILDIFDGVDKTSTTSVSFSINGTLIQSVAAGSIATLDSNESRIGRAGATFPNDHFNGKYQEFIIYPSDQSANRTGIEANINAHYNIYP